MLNSNALRRSSLPLPSLVTIRAEIARRKREQQGITDQQRGLLGWCEDALEPQGLAPARHHKLIISQLEAISCGDIDRLMLLCPPGSAKSTYASVLFPPWWFQQHPRSAIIAASHTQELADKFGRQVRNSIVLNAERLGYSIQSDSKAAGRWETTTGGEYFAVGVSGHVSGRRLDFGLIDDPIGSREDAESQTIRDRIWDWYKADFYPRLKPNAKIALIMTSWHEDDLRGRLMYEQANGGDKWHVIKLPAFATEVNDPLGRAINEPLWPEWEDREALERKRKALGERDFGALFQQDPRPAGTSYFNVDNCLIDGAPGEYPTYCNYVFATLDTAVKTGKKNDGTAICYWALNKIDKYRPLTLLDYDIIQIDGAMLEDWLPSAATRLEHLAVECRARLGSQGIFIEDKASGTILIQQAIRRDIQAQAIDSALSAVGKDERAISVSGYVNSGMVKISKHAYDKIVVYKGRSGNHLLMQVFRFQLGVPNQDDDLMDSWCYGIIISLGDNEGF